MSLSQRFYRPAPPRIGAPAPPRIGAPAPPRIGAPSVQMPSGRIVPLAQFRRVLAQRQIQMAQNGQPWGGGGQQIPIAQNGQPWGGQSPASSRLIQMARSGRPWGEQASIPIAAPGEDWATARARRVAARDAAAAAAPVEEDWATARARRVAARDAAAAEEAENNAARAEQAAQAAHSIYNRVAGFDRIRPTVEISANRRRYSEMKLWDRLSFCWV